MPRPVDFSGRSDIQHYDKANADKEKMYSQELIELTQKYTIQKQNIQKLRGQAVGDSAKLLELDEFERKLNDKYAQDKANLYTEYHPSNNRSVDRVVNEQKRQEAASELSTQSKGDKQQTVSTDEKDTSSESDNTMNGIFDSLGNYFRSMNKSDAPGVSNLRNQAKMHDTQAGEEQANAQQSQQIANRDYRGEAEKNAVASAATQNAQTVANLGNVSAGAAALERTVGTPDYNTHMNRQDEQREKAVEKQREAWGARQTAEEERQAAEAENNDKSNIDMYNSLARYLSMGAGGNNTDTAEQGATSTGSTPENTNPQPEDTNPQPEGGNPPPEGTEQNGGEVNTETEHTDNVQQPTTPSAGTQQQDTETAQQPTTPSAYNTVPSVPVVNNVEPDKINVDAVTDAAGEQPLKNQVVTQGINDAVARKEAYNRENEFWNEYTGQIPNGGDNSRKQTYENIVAFQEDNPYEMSKPVSEQVSDFIKQDSNSYQNVDIDEILGAPKGKYPPWLVAQAASIRNNAENSGDRQTADALSERFHQLYYTYTNKNSWYNKLSPQEQKKFNELYANAPAAEQEAFLSASTDEQPKIYQSWLGSHVVNKDNLDNTAILGNQDAYPQFLVDATRRYEDGKSAAHGLAGNTGKNLDKLKDLYTSDWYQSLSDSDKQILNSLTNEQLDEIYFYPGKAQEYMQGILDNAHLKAYGSGKGSNYNTSPAVTDYDFDAWYAKAEKPLQKELAKLDVIGRDAYARIMNNKYDYSPIQYATESNVYDLNGARSDLGYFTTTHPELAHKLGIEDRLKSIQDKIASSDGSTQPMDMPVYKGDFSDIGGDEFNDIYASWKRYTPERQKLFDGMDKEGQEHWIRLRTGHASDADALYFAENYSDDELRDFHQFGFGDSMMAEIQKARQKLADENTESDARQKNIIAGCFSRF